MYSTEPLPETGSTPAHTVARSRSLRCARRPPEGSAELRNAPLVQRCVQERQELVTSLFPRTLPTPRPSQAGRGLVGAPASLATEHAGPVKLPLPHRHVTRAAAPARTHHADERPLAHERSRYGWPLNNATPRSGGFLIRHSPIYAQPHKRTISLTTASNPGPWAPDAHPLAVLTGTFPSRALRSSLRSGTRVPSGLLRSP